MSIRNSKTHHYQRHEPENTTLYKLIQGNWLLFQQQVEHVLPHKNIRQWVLTFPVPIRLCLAVRPKVMARGLEISHLVTSEY